MELCVGPKIRRWDNAVRSMSPGEVIGPCSSQRASRILTLLVVSLHSYTLSGQAELSFTLPQFPQLHHRRSTTVPHREHSQNAGPLGAAGGLLLAPLLLFLKDTILEWLRSAPLKGRAGRLAAVAAAGVVRGRFDDLSCVCPWFAPAGLAVPHASQAGRVSGFSNVQVPHAHSSLGGGATGPSAGVGLSAPQASQLR